MSDPRKRRPFGTSSVFSTALEVRENTSVKKGRAMQQTLWGKGPKRRRRRTLRPLPTTTPYSITGTNDCEILGHMPNAYDLAGCSTCIDCAVHVFCPRCTPQHPTDEHAIPVVCPRHEESAVSA